MVQFVNGINNNYIISNFKTITDIISFSS